MFNLADVADEITKASTSTKRPTKPTDGTEG
jgi:hypothetical protein